MQLSIETKNVSTGRRQHLISNEENEERKQSNVSQYNHDQFNNTLDGLAASSRLNQARSDHETSYRILKPRMGDRNADSSIGHMQTSGKHSIDRQERSKRQSVTRPGTGSS